MDIIHFRDNYITYIISFKVNSFRLLNQISENQLTGKKEKYISQLPNVLLLKVCICKIYHIQIITIATNQNKYNLK